MGKFMIILKTVGVVGILVFGVLLNVTGISGQESPWSKFERTVFHVVENVIQTVMDEDISEEERQSLQEQVAPLEALWSSYFQEGHCPSPEVCQTFRYIIQKTQQIVNSAPGTIYSAQEWQDIAFLRQALHNYRSSSGQPQQTASVSESQSAQPQQTQSASATAVQQSRPPDFGFASLYRPGGQGEFLTLEDGGVMHSGDHYKIVFQTGESCYVYIFQADSSGKIYGLFPLTHFRGEPLSLANPVRPHTQYFVPALDKSFKLDQTVGTEQIFFLVLREQDPELEQNYQAVVQAQNANDPEQIQQTQAKLMKGILQKGPVSVVPDQNPQSVQSPQANEISWQEAGDMFDASLQRLFGDCGGECLYVLTFTHK